MRWLLLLLLVSCAAPSHFSYPSWPDTRDVLELARCAISQKYPASVADEVVDGAIIYVSSSPEFKKFFRGRTSVNGKTITLADDASTARSSPLLHELFAHRLQKVAYGDVNPYHQESVAVEEAWLMRRVQECDQ